MSSKKYEESGDNLDLALLTFAITLFMIRSVMYIIYEGMK